MGRLGCAAAVVVCLAISPSVALGQERGLGPGGAVSEADPYVSQGGDNAPFDCTCTKIEIKIEGQDVVTTPFAIDEVREGTVKWWINGDPNAQLCVEVWTEPTPEKTPHGLPSATFQWQHRPGEPFRQSDRFTTNCADGEREFKIKGGPETSPTVLGSKMIVKIYRGPCPWPPPVTRPDSICPNEDIRFTILKVGLDVANGQGGSLLDEDKEETPGAFTVANLNDTDGDGTTDKDDSDVSAAASGRDEVDLMRIVLHKPEPDLGDKVKLKVVSGDVKIWDQSKKVTEVALTGGAVEFNTSDLDKTLWVEARAKSGALRDIALELEYKGCKDTVKATGIWADQVASAHDLKSAADLFAEVAWANMTTPPKDRIQVFGGVGMRPLSPTAGYNVIAIKWVVSPAGIGTEAGIVFDQGRQADGKVWTIDGGAATQIDAKIFPTGAGVDEQSNDDSNEIDESDKPNNDNEFFSEDRPGLPSNTAGIQNATTPDVLVWRANFREYLRLGMGADPKGDGLSGSRVSSRFEWHLRHRFQNNAGVWQRTTGNDPESTENDIGTGTITVGNAP
jgi:hypothetical protein